MKYVGVICEYHLFHCGHLRQLEQIHAREADVCVVSLMSGNFVQRGECAVVDKYCRAELAVRAGADLVLELPFPYAMSGASYFAKGAIQTLDALGVDAVCFGCESGVEELYKTTNRLNSEAFVQELHNHYDPTKSLAVRRSEVYRALYDEPLTTNPNDMLAIEYLSAMGQMKSNMQPMPIKRVGEWSATKTRAALRVGDREALCALTPPQIHPYLPVWEDCADISRLDRAILAFLRTTPKEQLRQFAEMTSDSAALLKKEAAQSSTVQELLERCAGKRYSNARLRRMIWSAVLGVTEQDLQLAPTYTTLLGANENGISALRAFKKRSKIPILTKPAHRCRLGVQAQRALQLEQMVRSWYSLAFAVPRPAQAELINTPFLLKGEKNSL